jgi:hypothetical protein
MTLSNNEIDLFAQKMECKDCGKKVNSSTKKAIIVNIFDGLYSVFCYECSAKHFKLISQCKTKYQKIHLLQKILETPSKAECSFCGKKVNTETDEAILIPCSEFSKFKCKDCWNVVLENNDDDYARGIFGEEK